MIPFLSDIISSCLDSGNIKCALEEEHSYPCRCVLLPVCELFSIFLYVCSVIYEIQMSYDILRAGRAGWEANSRKGANLAQEHLEGCEIREEFRCAREQTGNAREGRAHGTWWGSRPCPPRCLHRSSRAFGMFSGAVRGSTGMWQRGRAKRSGDSWEEPGWSKRGKGGKCIRCEEGSVTCSLKPSTSQVFRSLALNLGSPSACERKLFVLQRSHRVAHYVWVRFSGQAECKWNVPMQVLAFFILKMELYQAALFQF